MPLLLVINFWCPNYTNFLYSSQSNLSCLGWFIILASSYTPLANDRISFYFCMAIPLCLPFSIPKPAFVLGFPSEFLTVVGTKYAFVYCVPFLSQRDVKVGLFFSHLTYLKQSNERESKSIGIKSDELKQFSRRFPWIMWWKWGHMQRCAIISFCPGIGYGPRRKKDNFTTRRRREREREK